MTWNLLKSKQDASRNYILDTGDGAIETRFVQRGSEYFIVYLSSHNGCNQTCRFCHLTATGQTSFEPVTPSMYLTQAMQVFNSLPRPAQAASVVHYNFMARGEPLLNPYLVKGADDLFQKLTDEASWQGFKSKFLVSSIIPENFLSFNVPLSEVFRHPDSYLYYSLYSVNPEFRKKWLPRAMDPYKALDLIAEMQQKNKREIVLHWAFIEGQNDSEDDVLQTIEAVTSRGIDARFNLVRYNPYSEKQGKEPSEKTIARLFGLVNTALAGKENKIVPRVGSDVYASCGMFINTEEV